MLLPRGDEYHAAVQNPRTAFSDTQLQNSIVESGLFGLPKPYSGGFTTTYHLRGAGSDWAARCFTRDVPELQRRYQALGALLSRSANGVLVQADCLPQGIQVGGHWYPIIKMQWVHGDTLNSYVEKNLANRAVLAKLPQAFAQLVERLEALGIAHGDLQHGNIIVRSGGLVLIDYDGLYLPTLAGMKASELGHINYQHPARGSSDFDARIDRFSAMVIYLAVTALSVRPELWGKYDNGDNLLFRRDDLADPGSSALLKELRGTPEVAALAERLAGACRLAFHELPSLGQFLTGDFRFPIAASPHAPVAQRVSQYLVIDATKRHALLQHVGGRVEVVGLARHMRRLTTRRHEPCVFLNFGAAYPNHTFSIVIWADVLRANWGRLSGANSISGQWLSVTGVIDTYKGRPQIILDSPSQIRVLAGQKEARALISGKPLPVAPQGRSPHGKKEPASTVRDHEAAVLNQLYGKYPAASTPTTQRAGATGGTSATQPARPAPGTTGPASPATKSPCFVVTAAFGTPYAEEVQLFRRFRDQVLAPTLLGRWAARVYVVIGPGLAWLVRHVPGARPVAARALGRLVPFARRQLAKKAAP